MSWPTVLLVVAALVVFASALGVALQRRGVRERTTADSPRLTPADFGLERFSAPITIAQLSTAYCQRCPGVRRALVDLVDSRSEAAFVHVDLTDNPALAKQLHVLQTPTVLLIDAEGHPRVRLSGQLAASDIASALDQLTERSP